MRDYQQGFEELIEKTFPGVFSKKSLGSRYGYVICKLNNKSYRSRNIVEGPPWDRILKKYHGRKLWDHVEKVYGGWVEIDPYGREKDLDNIIKRKKDDMEQGTLF